jgi:hypothetical protein
MYALKQLRNPRTLSARGTLAPLPAVKERNARALSAQRTAGRGWH